MRRLIVLVCFFLVFSTGLSQKLVWAAGSGEEKRLVTINGTDYSAEDFKHWWQIWREEATPLPELPDEFIEWHLMAQEATKMQLFQEPSYRSKVDIFLRVRSLVFLQDEEVNRKISISNKEISDFYREQYIPRIKARVFYYTLGSPAEERVKALREGKFSVDELLALKPEEGGVTYSEEKWFRVPQAQGEWRTILQDARQGDFTRPVPMDKGFVILKIDERKGEDPQDLEQLKGGIEKKLRDMKRDMLTIRLVDSLKKKFGVHVDEAVLAKIGLDPLDKEISDKTVISSTQGNISAANFWASLQKEKGFREKNRFPTEEIEAMKRRVLDSIISQTVVSWEAMSRHYEEKEPFKWEYRFYCEHRLIKELEKLLVQPQVKVEDAEIETFYQKNTERFSHPETVSYLLLKGEPSAITKMWQKISSGQDIVEAASEQKIEKPLRQEMPVSQLSSELMKIVLPLRKGEVSLPFAYEGRSAVVQLLNHRQKTTLPLSQVREQIVQELTRQKYLQVRQNLLRKLKDGSEIGINQKVWDKLRKGLKNADVAVKNK